MALEAGGAFTGEIERSIGYRGETASKIIQEQAASSNCHFERLRGHYTANVELFSDPDFGDYSRRV
jgi:hypothetical protein